MGFRTFYTAKDEARKGLICDDKSLTRQEFLKESLTSTIIERFTKTGVMCPTVNPERVAQFGDFTQIDGDAFTVACRLKDAKSAFSELPSKIRSMFANDPVAFVRFMSDERNRAKAIELGLLPKPSKKANTAAAAQPEAAAAAQPAPAAQVADGKAAASAEA